MVRISKNMLSLICISAISCSTVSALEARSLFEFTKPDSASSWRIVNDGVMGGRSTSQASIVESPTGENAMRFSGNLSLENNGGFASVRSKPLGLLGLKSGEVIILRVKGDGRRYKFNLYTPDRSTAFSYQMDFGTNSGAWTTVRLPIDQFIAHSFGRPLPNMKLNPSQVHSVGILLGDKKPGKFELLVDSIEVER